MVGLCGVLTIVCLGATDSGGDPFGRVEGVTRALTTEGGADSGCTTPSGFPPSWCSSMQHVDSESLGILVELGIMGMLLKAAANNFPGRHLDFGEASCRADIKSREKNETRAEFRGLVNEDDARRGVSDLALKQIDSFVAGTGVLINLHITHHAGTTVCRAAKLDQACCNCADSCVPPQLDADGIFVLIDRYIDKHCKTDPADCGVGGSPKIQRLLEAFFILRLDENAGREEQGLEPRVDVCTPRPHLGALSLGLGADPHGACGAGSAAEDALGRRHGHG